MTIDDRLSRGGVAMTIVRRAAVTLAVWLAGSAALAATAAEPPYEINVLVPVTGGGAFLGKSYEEALTALENTVNGSGGIQGRPITFIVSDSQSTGQTGLQIVNGLMAKHVALFIDGGPSTVCSATIPIVQTAGPLDYCLSPLVTPVPRGYVFSAGASAYDFAAVAVRYLRNRGWKRLAMIVTTDTTGQAYERAIGTALTRPENRDVQLVASEHFNGADLSIAAQIARVEAAKPQALMLWATGTPLGTAVRGLKDTGYEIPVLTSNSNMTYAQMSAYQSVLPKELYFTSARGLLPEDTLRGPLRDAQTVYVNAFRKMNVRPDIGHSLIWDPAMVLVDALRHAGPNATSDQLHAYILGLHSWAGINGIYDFASGDQRGLGDGSIVVARWDPVKSTWVQVSAPKGALRP
jgi:branched-chain amino acid transport system substrate-binding protein